MTHPSVVYKPEGWKGWRYWMAFTPYPPVARENPSVVVSQDGVNWQTPPGGSNPVVPIAEMAGIGYANNSDPCLLLNASETALWLYYRPIYGTNNEGIFRKTSTDGITWSAGVSTGLTNATNYKLISPAVVVEDDDTYSMWVVDDTASTNAARVVKRTSADGLTWSSGTTCTVPSGFPIWHIDISRIDGDYYMLAPESDTATYPLRLHFLRSTDGLTWTGNHEPSIPLSGTTFDAGSKNYKSCLVPVAGDPLRWQMWIVGIGGSGIKASDDHRIALYEGSFDDGIGVLSNNRFTVAAPNLYPSFGSPSQSLVSSRWPVWLMDASSVEGVATSLSFPTNWHKANIILWWANAGAGTGDVVWAATYNALPTNSTMDGTGETSAGNVAATAGASGIIKKTTLASSVQVSSSDFLWHLRVNRIANNAADTLGNDAAIVAITIERAA